VTQLRNLGPPYNFGTNRTIHFKFGKQIKDGPFLRRPTEHKLHSVSALVDDLFSHDTCKTGKENHTNVNNNKTANIKV